jgi:tripartite-type tricarboxylate transporter receptor subunit TctC
VPAIAETIPGYEATTWVSIFAPAGTPKEIVDQLNRETGTALRDTNVASKLNEIAYDATYKTPGELAQRVKSAYDKIGKLFREIGVAVN